MIRCPTCGTLNQDSHRSCDNCGMALPQTKIRCPACGTPNSVGNLLCDNCNARLIQPEGIIPSDLPAESDSRAESSPVKGISLPTRAAANDGAVPRAGDERPDWLRGLTEGAEETLGTAGGPAEGSEEDEIDPSGGHPDWLSGLLDENADFGAAEEPDGPESETQDELILESNALPDWLAGEAAPEDELTPTGTDDSQSEPPDWLVATADTGDLLAEASEKPDLPDWLTASTEAAQAETPTDSELPDWLIGTSDEQEVETLPGELSATATDKTPTWYDDVADTSAESAETERTGIQSESEPLIFSESEPPNWLAEAQALADNTDIGGTPDSETQFETSAQPSTEPELSADLPDWFSAVDDSEESGDIELPDWLQTMSQEGMQEPSETPAPEMSAVSSASPELEPAELPEWLTGLEVGTAAVGGAAIFASDDEIPEELTVQPQEGPSWLQDIKPATETTQDEPTAPVFVQGDAGIEREVELTPSQDEPAETPGWLLELDFTGPEQPPAQSGILEGDMPAPAELPGWLQDLRPQSSSATVFGVSDQLASADIPDWLQALRPEPGAAGEAPPHRVALPTPAEPDGPLQGVPGVLQPLALIDAPADVKVGAETAIPEAVIAQAQLWQSLLERPRSAERPVSHVQPRSEATTALIRLLVAAILILGVLEMFLLLPEGLRLASASPAQLAPGAPALIESLDALQPGDRVIVAVEYGTAYAEEMRQVAMPVLQQLTAQQAEITIVSTLPEGAALGAVLATEAEAQAGSARLDSSYLAGNASGISAFLSQPDAQAARHILVLSSQPERLRWWIEQVQLAYDSAPAPVSLSVGVSAAAGPIVAPYLATLQIQGWLVGLPDALAYRELRGVEDTDSAARTLNVLMLAQWAAGGLLVIGLLVSLVAGRKGARESHV